MQTIGLISSNFRPEYQRAAKIASDAESGSLMVFSYQPQYVATDLALNVNTSVVVYGQQDGERFCPNRCATIVSVDVYKGRIFITLKLDDRGVESLNVIGRNDLTEGKVVFGITPKMYSLDFDGSRFL